MKLSKEELLACNDETWSKLKVHLPQSGSEINLSLGKDDWGMSYVSYGNEDEMVELVNLILGWRDTAQRLKALDWNDITETVAEKCGLYLDKNDYRSGIMDDFIVVSKDNLKKLLQSVLGEKN